MITKKLIISMMLVVALITAGMVGFAAAEEDIEEKGDLTITVEEDGEPVSEDEIGMVVDPDFDNYLGEVKTDENGDLHYEDAVNGEYYLEFEIEDEEWVTSEIFTHDSDNTELTFDVDGGGDIAVDEDDEEDDGSSLPETGDLDEESYDVDDYEVRVPEDGEIKFIFDAKDLELGEGDMIFVNFDDVELDDYDKRVGGDELIMGFEGSTSEFNFEVDGEQEVHAISIGSFYDVESVEDVDYDLYLNYDNVAGGGGDPSDGNGEDDTGSFATFIIFGLLAGGTATYLLSQQGSERIQ